MILNKNNKQVLILFISTILGVLLGVISSVINTRFLSPHDYGDVRYVQNIINLFSCIYLLGYFVSGSRLLALSKTLQENRGIKGVMVIMLFKTILLLMISIIFCYFFHLYFKKTIDSTLFLISIPVCAQSLMLNYINTTAQGDNQIVRIACARLLPALIYILLSYPLYKIYGATSTNMILLQWGTATLILGIIIASTHPSFRNYSFYKKELQEENKKYGIHLYLGSLAMVATQYVSGVTLGMFNENNTEVAYYTLALTVSMPLAMLPSIVGTSYFKKFASQDKIEKKVMYGTLGVTVISLILYIILIQPIVLFLYPKEYSSVGIYASILAIGKCCHGFGDMINRFLGAHGQGKYIRNASFACGFFLLTGSTVFVYYYGISGALITNITSSIIYMLVLIYYYRTFLYINKENGN